MSYFDSMILGAVAVITFRIWMAVDNIAIKLGANPPEKGGTCRICVDVDRRIKDELGICRKCKKLGWK